MNILFSFFFLYFSLEEQRQAEAEIAAVEQEIAREAIKAGLVDPTPTSDLFSAGLSIEDGDYWGVGLSFFSATVPYLGDAIAKPIKATRMARKAAKLKHKAAQPAKSRVI